MKRADHELMEYDAFDVQIYTIWNFRREALGPVFEAASPSPSSSSPTSDDEDQSRSQLLSAARTASDTELALTQACLTENPKSYSAWHHRKWVVAKGLCKLDAELKLVTRALDQDNRNFHAWSYRKVIVSLMKRGGEVELGYSEEKIAQDFSNYSAFHYRTTLLPREGGGGREGEGLIAPSVLDEEFDMVHQAFATDCKDQSPWIYYRWLLGQCVAHLEASRDRKVDHEVSEGLDAGSFLHAVYEREIERMKEDHLSAEPDAKWPLITLAVLTEGKSRLSSNSNSNPSLEGGGEGMGPGVVCPESRAIYERLIHLDPMRAGFYKDAIEGRADLIVKR